MHELPPKILDHFTGRLPDGDLWVFGYASLMWNPGFPFRRRSPARLHGYHRSLCVSSTRNRGTPEQPGLVMGLAAGGSCHGMAYLIDQGEVMPTLLSLWQREMRNRTYQPKLLPVVAGGERVRALAFVADKRHRNYAGKLDIETIAARVASCHGERGANFEYVANTVAHLAEFGVRDPHLCAVCDAARALLERNETLRTVALT